MEATNVCKHCGKVVLNMSKTLKLNLDRQVKYRLVCSHCRMISYKCTCCPFGECTRDEGKKNIIVTKCKVLLKDAEEDKNDVKIFTCKLTCEECYNDCFVEVPTDVIHYSFYCTFCNSKNDVCNCVECPVKCKLNKYKELVLDVQ